MAISLDIESGPYTATAGQTVFPFGLSLASASEIEVLVNGATVSSNGYSVAFGDTAGTVTFVSGLNAGDIVLIRNNPDFSQATEFDTQGAYTLKAVNSNSRRSILRDAWLKAKVAVASLPTGSIIDALGTATDKAPSQRAVNAKLADLQSTSIGASLVGANDGASGSIFTTVAGFIAKLLSSAGSSVIGFIQAGTGAVLRTLQDKSRDIVSVKDFGAKGDGSTDDTNAFVLALAYIALRGYGTLYVPTGAYIVSSTIVLPYGTFFSGIRGEGRSSIIRAKTGIAAFDIFNWNPPAGAYSAQEISDLTIDGSNLVGSGNLINTAGMGGVRILRLYMTNLMTTGSGIVTNGKSATYNHDVYIDDIYIDSTTGGFGINVGGLASDNYIGAVTVQGRGTLNYGVYFNPGAAHIQTSDCHLYNCAQAQLAVGTPSDSLWFDNVNCDNGGGGAYNFYGTGMAKCTFTSCQFIYGGASTDLITLINCTDNNFVNTNLEGNGTRWGINESGTSDRNIFKSLNYTGSFASGLATLVGANSGVFKLGTQTVISGTTSVAAGATAYAGYGSGAGLAETSVQVVSPHDGYLRLLRVAVPSAPGASQTLTVTARVNGVDQSLTATLSGAASFSATGTALIPVNAGDGISLKAVNSASAASNTPRMTLTIQH